MKLEFPRDILEKIETSSFIKIRPAGVKLFHADRQTDMKLIFACPNFANALKNSGHHEIQLVFKFVF